MFVFYSRCELQSHLSTTRSLRDIKKKGEKKRKNFCSYGTFAEQKFPKPALKRTNACEERQRRDGSPTPTANLLFSAQGLFVHTAAPLIAQLGRERTSERFHFLTKMHTHKKNRSVRQVFALFNEKVAIPTPIVELTRPTVGALCKKSSRLPPPERHAADTLHRTEWDYSAEPDQEGSLCRREGQIPLQLDVCEGEKKAGKKK